MDNLDDFFSLVWGDEKVAPNTFVYLPIKENDGSDRGSWTTFMFDWPRQRKAVVKHVLKWNATPTLDVYYSPALFAYANPKRESVLGSHVLWVDFDGNAPKTWEGSIAPEPTLRIQSSIEGHEHCYWKLDTFLDDPTQLEELNRSLAYALKADTSGWDADQILRPPFTMNRKRDKEVTVKAFLK